MSLRLLVCIPSRFGCLSCQHDSTCSCDAAKKTHHVINYQRTQTEILQALRPKSNFLLSNVVDKHRLSPLQQGTEAVAVETETTAPRDYRFVMPEFLPNADYRYRDRVLEKLERQDMLRRRAVIDIPEFYVGSIMAVCVSDPHAPGKRNRFVGICIDRSGQGLRAHFVLRNVVDGLGVEVMYKMYNPTVLSVEVLKLEKRLDDQLYYLRNCPLEYSTFDFNMDPVILPRGSQVPVNPIKVKLNPKPWEYRWERFNLKGIEPISLTPKMIKGIEKSAEPWRQNDLMMMYRSQVHEEEETEIMAEVYKEKHRIDSQKKTSRAAQRKNK
ncbi:unnamed protein product [Candidula unifasciata]|uniref:Large ribosomal subunit protein bL19m n=1 Tax=Candidula unifasciata TaxID=100452 RepID=A0A8S3Z0P6_9EUPU|nr:unnamed protein product [Candidula unifasciata]